MNSSDKVELIFFNKTESDIWLREKFDDLKSKDDRLSIRHVLSEPDPSWSGETGRITKAIVEEIAQSATFAFICGPTAFSDITADHLREQQVDMHCFQG